MRLAVLLCLLLLCFAFADAAVLEGVVLDDESGFALARAQITLLPLPGATNAAPLTIRSGDRGAFSILSVRAGWYVLRVSRPGYAIAEAGQLRAGRPGAPFEVTGEDRATFFQIRMRRLPAIAGTVLDENGIGIADWPVHIYTARKPVRRVAETKTDDRGMFRIGGLDPGSYVVRSAAGELDEEYSLLPTYSRFGTALANAEPIGVRIGETYPDAVIRPVRGRLFSISGVFNVPADRAGQLTLVTDTGRRLIASASGPSNTTVRFEAVAIPPGPVELIAEGRDCGGYARIVVDRDTQGIRIGCTPLYPLSIDWMSDNSRQPFRYPVFLRRVDLDGVGPAKLWKERETFGPGHWEVMAQPAAAHYVTGMRANYGSRATGGEDGWFGMDLDNSARILIELSSKPASITGEVTANGRPVTGAVVYLEAYNPDLTDGRIHLWSTRTDVQGSYSFNGLRPGNYRVLSTFDFDPEDRFAMKRASALTLREGDRATQFVELALP